MKFLNPNDGIIGSPSPANSKIALGDDLQHPENFHKAACLLGFLKEKFDEEDILSSPQKHSWQIIGESLLYSLNY